MAAAWAALRWLLFSVEPDIGWLILLQMFQALTFSMTYLGLMRIMARLIGPHRSSSVQGRYVTIQAVFSAVATLAAGALFKSHGPWAFMLSAGLALLALILLAAIGRYRPRRSKGHSSGGSRE